MPKDKHAENPTRTDFAEDRTILASERTFASWMRTSLGCIAIGVGFHALFNKVEPSWVPRLIATGFLLMATIVIWLAARRAAAVAERLHNHVVECAEGVNLDLLAVAVSLGALSLAAAIWFLPIA